MDKNDLIKLINEELSPLSFKKKGNHWQLNTGEITKYLRIQKSQYSNLFYIYYGYILEKLKTKDNSNHYEKGFNTWVYSNSEKQDLLNFEDDIDKEFRIIELRRILREEVLSNFESVNSEKDVLEDIKKLPSIEVVFVSIRKYFKLK